jgi:hypothetical protein
MAKKKQPAGSDGAALDPTFFKSVGGKKLALGKDARFGEVWNFGWVPPENRDEDAHAGDHSARVKMPRFAISGTPNRSVYETDKALLCDLWKHPDVVKANEQEFTGVHQISGSCVGAGGGNAWMTLACVEAIRLSEPELPKVPFWLLPYGRSRYYCGMKTPGEGSLGSCFARAAIEDGTLPYDQSGLPQPSDRADGWVWGRAVELKWSDGDAKPTLDLLPSSRKYLIRTAAQCRSADDVREAIVNGYPCTAASMYAHDGGRVQGSGKDACLLARRSGSWSHQMSVQAWWLHPQFGELFWLHNQWGLRAHGVCPTGMPPGGVWITKSDMDWICRDEVFALSGNNGFPAPVGPLPWIW